MRLQQEPKLVEGVAIDQLISQVLMCVAYGRHILGAGHVRGLLRTQQWHHGVPYTDEPTGR